MAAAKSLTLQCMGLGDALSDVASQHSSGSGSSSSASGSRSGPGSVAPSVHEGIQEAIASPLHESVPFDGEPFEVPRPSPAPSHAPSEAPVALPVDVIAVPSPRQSPLPAGPKQPVQRRLAKQQAVATRSPSPVPSPAKARTAPVKDESNRNKQLMTYLLLPSVAFLAAYFAGPMIAPSLFENRVTKEQDTKKVLLVAALAACGTVLTARCIL